MVDPVSVLIGAASSIAGAATGAAITLLTTRARARVQLVFDIYRDFNSVEFCATRRRAHSLLQQNPGKNIQEMEAVEEGHSIFVILRFYQRLWTLIESRLIPTRHVGRLFGEVFYLWYYDHFEYRLLPLNWQLARDIESLKNWFERECPAEQTRLWVDRAKHTIAIQPKPPALLGSQEQAKNRQNEAV